MKGSEPPGNPSLSFRIQVRDGLIFLAILFGITGAQLLALFTVWSGLYVLDVVGALTGTGLAGIVSYRVPHAIDWSTRNPHPHLPQDAFCTYLSTFGRRAFGPILGSISGGFLLLLLSSVWQHRWHNPAGAYGMPLYTFLLSILFATSACWMSVYLQAFFAHRHPPTPPDEPDE